MAQFILGTMAGVCGLVAAVFVLALYGARLRNGPPHKNVYDPAFKEALLGHCIELTKRWVARRNAYRPLERR
jgi:hypothetical protein